MNEAEALKILYLEDDADDVELIGVLLSKENISCKITHVESKYEFTTAIKNENFDLILADFVLPAFDGMKALAIVQEICPDVPFIFVSGAIGEDMAIETLKQGATDYVLKDRLSRLAPAILRAFREMEERKQRQKAEEEIRRSKNQFAAILSGINEGIIVQQPHGPYIYANDKAAQIVGYSSADTLLQASPETLGQKFLPRDVLNRPLPQNQLPSQLALQGQEPDELRMRYYNYLNDEDSWLVMSATPVFGDAGEVQFAVSILHDVTEQMRLLESEREARQVAEAAATRIASLQSVTTSLGEALNPVQVTQIVVDQGITALGASAGSVALHKGEENILEIIYAAGYEDKQLQSWQQFSLETHMPLTEAVITGKPIFLESVQAADSFPILLEQAQGSHSKAWVAIPLGSKEDVIGAMGLSFDQAQVFSQDDRNFMLALGRQCAQALERARLYEAESLARSEMKQLNTELEELVRQRTTQVRQLASELISSEQTVRQHIAQTLHDDMQQMLYAANMQLQFLESELGENDHLNSLIAMITQSIDLARELTIELSPPVLEREGLHEALAWLSDYVLEHHDLQVAIEVADGNSNRLVTVEQRILLYQIVRELLLNVIKHARVEEATVYVESGDEGLSIVVSDQGLGFDVASILNETGSSFGLSRMHERLQLFDGYAEINSHPGEGTKISLFLPYAA